MKTLKKFQLFTITVLLIAGMSSCLKSEQEFQIQTQGYLTQTNTGSGESVSSKFIPSITIAGNEVIAKATAKSGIESFSFSHITNVAQNYMDMDTRYYSNDSIPADPFTITAYNVDNEVATAVLSFKGLKKLGSFEVKNIKYTKGNGITAEWTKSENATGYCVAARLEEEGGTWVYYTWDDQTTSSSTSGTFRNGNSYLQNGKKYRIAVVALSNGIRLMGEKIISITIGTDYTEPADQ